MEQILKKGAICSKLFLLVILFLSNKALGQKSFEFDTTYWKTKKESIVEFDGKKCLLGDAELKGVLFKNGIIEFDVWTEGGRSYPGIKFRDTGNGNCEDIYIRPHRSGTNDALQYAPSFNGSTCWQLYHSKGFTTNTIIEKGKWLHFKIEVNGNKATLYFNNAKTPTLQMNLVHTPSKGSIALSSTISKNYFTSFKIQELSDNASNEDISKENMIDNGWEISQLLDANVFNSGYPGFYKIASAGWEKVKEEPSGLIPISKYRAPERGKKDCVYARRIIYSESDKKIKLAFGYSDAAKVFINGQLIYSGNYAFKSRHSSFLGAIGLHDTLYVDLQKGLNELFVISKEYFGGWGIIFKEDPRTESRYTVNTKASKLLWKTEKVDLVPESAVYDPKSKTIYASNFDTRFSKHEKALGFISKIDLKGNVIKSKWVDGLIAPTGICIYKDNLYVVDRKALVEISISKQKVIQKYEYPEGIRFANDVAVDNEGNFYITNSDETKGVVDIYRLKNKKIEPWISSELLASLNGIYFEDGHLIVGNSHKKLVQKIDVKTKDISTIISMGKGVVDGIKKDNNGNYLISIWEDGLYRVAKTGEITKLIETNGKFNIADFEYIKHENLVIVPSFLGKDVKAFTID